MPSEYRIWEILKKQGRSIKWLAENTQTSTWQVYHFRLGDRKPTDDFERRCENLLGVPRDVLFSVLQHSVA